MKIYINKKPYVVIFKCGLVTVYTISWNMFKKISLLITYESLLKS